MVEHPISFSTFSYTMGKYIFTCIKTKTYLTTDKILHIINLSSIPQSMTVT